MFEIENDDLSPEQRDALNAALAPPPVRSPEGHGSQEIRNRGPT